MFYKKCIFSFLILFELNKFCLTFTPTNLTQKIVCYCNSLSLKRHSDQNQFNISNFNATLCTHMIYAYGQIENGTIQSVFPENNFITMFTNLKIKKPSLKILLAIADDKIKNSKNVSKMIMSDKYFQIEFARNVIEYLRKSNFDGLDIKLNIPTQDYEVETLMFNKNLLGFLHILRKELEISHLIFTAAIKPNIKNAYPFYTIRQLCSIFKFINLLSFDMHDSTKTSIHSPLLKIHEIINTYQHAGCPKWKINLGIAAYGHTYLLKNSKNHNIGSPVDGYGPISSYTNSEGTLGYNEICYLQKTQKWNTKYFKNESVIYTWYNNYWVNYDNTATISDKVKYVLSKDLGGVMLWSIDTDDYGGICNNGKYPLLTAIDKSLYGF